MINYTLDNGWLVSKEEKKPAILHVEPITNSIFSTSQRIQLPDVIFDAIVNGERGVKELFRLYKMHDLIFQWDRKNTEIAQIHTRDSNVKFYGGGWFVEMKDGFYFLEYIKSSQGGGGRRIQINRDIYYSIRDTGKNKSLSEILDENGLRDQDIKENDI